MLIAVIKDCLLRLNLSLNKVRGQCYDGASNMSGIRNGVAKKIRDDEPRAIYTHCYGHSLNLAVGDTIKNSSIMKNEITKLVKYSPRRESLFNAIKDDMSPGNIGIRTLCPTRWTVRADSMQSIIKNYSVLQELWDQAISVTRDTETISRIRGIEAHMKTFEFFFGLVLGELLLRHTDNLSRTLQKNFSASEGQIVAEKTKATLLGIRSDDNFELFWKKVIGMSQQLDVEEPRLSRRRKIPRRYDDGHAEPHFPTTPEEHYRGIYYEALDLLIQGIEDRFNQSGYHIYCCLEELLVKAIKREVFEEELDKVMVVYGEDLNAANLKMQLEMLSHDFPEGVSNFCDVKEHIKKLSHSQKTLLNEVILLAKLILVMPATNATSERSFSALRRMKTYLRSTMKQDRLNSVMTLHIHKDLTDHLSLNEVANFFISKSDRRQQIFGQF